MKEIFVDRAFFDLSNKKSDGLITGLKMLSQNSYRIYSEKVKRFDTVILQILKSEGIKISEKPKSSVEPMIEILLKGKSNNNSYVVGSPKYKTFLDAAEKAVQQKRSSAVKRTTKETDIRIKLTLDGEGKGNINTGIGFFDHMLEQIARHANMNLDIKVKGDLHIDEHHTIEDTGIALGEAIRQALGDKKGIKRYGYFIPMDESVAVCSIDLSGRNYLNFSCKFAREFVGKFPTELTKEFFRGLANGMLANIYLSAKGENDHHKIEALFKSFAKALNEASRIDERAKGKLPSTKGLL